MATGETDLERGEATPAPFTRWPDPRCMRGLHLVYQASRALAVEELAARLQEAFDHRLVESVEAWGARRVVRLVLQFRFELRLNSTPTRADFILRETCPVPDRDALRLRFEAVLGASLS